MYLHIRIFTRLVFPATMNIRKFEQPFFSETVAVTNGPVVPVAVLHTSLLCIKKDILSPKLDTFYKVYI